MTAIVYVRKYDDNPLYDYEYEVNIVRCLDTADYEDKLETILSDHDKYTLIGVVDLDKEDAIRHSVLVFNAVITKFYNSGIALYISCGSNVACVELARRNFVSNAEIKTSEDFKTLVSNFFADLKISVDYISDNKIIFTRR